MGWIRCSRLYLLRQRIQESAYFPIKTFPEKNTFLPACKSQDSASHSVLSPWALYHFYSPLQELKGQKQRSWNTKQGVNQSLNPSLHTENYRQLLIKGSNLEELQRFKGERACCMPSQTTSTNTQRIATWKHIFFISYVCICVRSIQLQAWSTSEEPSPLQPAFSIHQRGAEKDPLILSLIQDCLKHLLVLCMRNR